MRIMKRSGAWLLVFFLIQPALPASLRAELEREQEDAYDVVAFEKEPQKPELKSPAFWRYAYRIVTAPFVLIINYPRSEDPDLYNSYLEWVNHGTTRNWKRKNYDIKKGPSLVKNSGSNPDENPEKIEQASEEDSSGNAE